MNSLIPSSLAKLHAAMCFVCLTTFLKSAIIFYARICRFLTNSLRENNFSLRVCTTLVYAFSNKYANEPFLRANSNSDVIIAYMLAAKTFSRREINWSGLEAARNVFGAN